MADKESGEQHKQSEPQSVTGGAGPHPTAANTDNPQVQFTSAV